MEGKRPARPLHDLSRTRGLNDEVWSLVESCWAQNPAERPSADQVVKQLRSLPNRPSDQRPFDHLAMFDQRSWLERDHPFSTLAPNNENSAEMEDLKWISRPMDDEFDYR